MVIAKYKGLGSSDGHIVSRMYLLYQELAEEKQTLRSRFARKIRKLRKRVAKLAEAKAVSKIAEIVEEERKRETARLRAELNDFKRECLEVSLAITREILQVEVAASAPCLNRIREALSFIGHGWGEEVTVAINQKTGDLVGRDLIQEGLKVRIEDSLPNGDARIETQSGSVVLEWEDSFEKITAPLKACIHE